MHRREPPCLKSQPLLLPSVTIHGFSPPNMPWASVVCQTLRRQGNEPQLPLPRNGNGGAHTGLGADGSFPLSGPRGPTRGFLKSLGRGRQWGSLQQRGDGGGRAGAGLWAHRQRETAQNKHQREEPVSEEEMNQTAK